MTVLCTMRNFPSVNIVASILLFVAAIAAAIIANSPAAPVYQGFLLRELHLQIGNFNLLLCGEENLRMIESIGDELMIIFFLLIGLETKRELLVGELFSLHKAALPSIAACGGMLFPVIVYMSIYPPGSAGSQGLAISVTMDITLPLGVLNLLGSRVPLSLKILLTASAVVDDIRGILVIALLYSSHVSHKYILIVTLLYVLFYFIGKRRTTNKIFFLVIGVAIWYSFLQPGTHSTISGAILAFVIPVKPRLYIGRYIEHIRHTITGFPVVELGSVVLTNEQIAKLRKIESAPDRVISPLQSLEDNLHGAVSYLILPLFAFVNAGIVFSGGGELVGSAGMAVAAGLLSGKFVGIYFFTWLAIKIKLTSVPPGMTWRNPSGMALLGGVGFMVLLFIANLSSDASYPVLLNQAKFGVLSRTILSGLLGYVVLGIVSPVRRQE